jgi:hypothetical protein
MSDPIVNEVRQARMAHTRKCHGDLAAIAQDLREVQRSCGHKVVRLAPRRLQPTSASRRTA